jgi:aryl-alcohol dehydrogenase-like predicted oxidoreductase
LPCYQQEYAENNKNLSQGFAAIAGRKGCTAAQLAIAWVLAQDEHLIPIPGTKKVKYLQENAGAVDVRVTPEGLQAIDELLIKYPDTGERYN